MRLDAILDLGAHVMQYRLSTWQVMLVLPLVLCEHRSVSSWLCLSVTRVSFPGEVRRKNQICFIYKYSKVGKMFCASMNIFVKTKKFTKLFQLVLKGPKKKNALSQTQRLEINLVTLSLKCWTVFCIHDGIVYCLFLLNTELEALRVPYNENKYFPQL